MLRHAIEMTANTDHDEAADGDGVAGDDDDDDDEDDDHNDNVIH